MKKVDALDTVVSFVSGERMPKEKEPAALRPHWPKGLEVGKSYRVSCDDKGRNGGTWLDVFIAEDGDVHVFAQDWEEIGQPDDPGASPFPHIRIRTTAGGGRNWRTRQALLILADAIRRDNAENGLDSYGMKPGSEEL